MDIAYVQKVQEWVQMDNILLKNKDDVKEIVKKKKELEDEIIEYVEKNKHDRLTINISDGNIKFGKRNVVQPLSLKTIKGILDKYATDHRNVDVGDIMQFISENLESKHKVVMRREVKGASVSSDE